MMPSVREGQAALAGRTILRAEQHLVVGLGVTAYAAAASARGRVSSTSWFYSLTSNVAPGATKQRAIVQVVVTYCAAVSACGRASSVSGPYISHVRCGATPSCQMWSRTVQPSVRAKRGPAASASIPNVAPIVLLQSCFSGAGSVCNAGCCDAVPARRTS